MTTGSIKLGAFAILIAVGGLGGKCHDQSGGPSQSGAGGATQTGGGGSSQTGGGGSSQTGGGGSSQTGGGGGSTGAEGGSGPASPILKFETITNGGSGCPMPGDVTASVNKEKGLLILEYMPAALSAPPGAGFRHNSCAVGLTVRGIAGFQFAGVGVNGGGAVKLSDAAEGKVKAELFFAGDPASSVAERSFTGPLDEPYDLTDSFADNVIVRSACGADSIFSINVSLTLKNAANPQKDASINIKRIEIPIVWTHC